MTGTKAAAPKVEGLWQRCEGPDVFHKACLTKSGKGSRGHQTEGQGSKVICGKCAQREGLTRVMLMGATDTVAQREGATDAALVKAARTGTHKALFTSVLPKGSTPEAVAKVIAGLQAQRGSGQAPKVKAQRVTKPKAKTA